MSNIAPSERRRNRTKDRITVEALQFYVPLFHAGDEAEKRILNGGLTAIERNALETRARLKDLSVKKIASLSGPLISSEIKKIIASSHIPYSDDLFDILYYAGMNGFVKGLRHFDEKKMKKSATNYLFQWFNVYAKRELSIIEAPFGVAPSRFQKYKKISAVRKKLSTELDRDVSNEEIFEYFQSGQADLKNFYGKLGSSNQASKANKNITLDLIREQEEFEQKFMNVQLLDPLENYQFDDRFSQKDDEPFSQTAFGIFSEKYGVSFEAQVVLQSELGKKSISTDVIETVSAMPPKRYSELVSAWKSLIQDVNSPFYSFLKEIDQNDFSQFDIASTVASIEESGKTIDKNKYEKLFER